MKNYFCVINLLILALQVVANTSNLLENFVVANRKFTTDVYKEANKVNSGNLLICPLSAEIILGLVRFGAKGNTAKELALNIEVTEEDAKNIFAQLNKELKSKDKYVLSSANNIFLSEIYKIKDKFLEVAFNDFSAPIQNVDFRKKQEAVKKINTWIENRTNNKIKNLISEDLITPDTAAVLVNTIYFNGQWVNQFDPQATFEQDFYLNDTKTVKTKMMSTDDYFNYYDSKELNAEFLEMPFEGDDLTLTIVLPKKKFGLNQLEEKLSDVLLPQNYRNLKVEIFIPKFKIETDIRFKSILQSMGIREAFSSKADFSGITDTLPPLVIDEVVQKTFLEINEKGATAAAATGLFFTALSAPNFTFKANHPFLFYLTHKVGGIIFIGKFVEPIV